MDTGSRGGGVPSNVISERTQFSNYIGETARPIRERAIEHEKNKTNWKTESFQISHWMEHHPLETQCPKFKYEVIGRFGDPMRRQLNEAINILHSGILNRRMEFGRNELCRLEPSRCELDKEKYFQAEMRERKNFKTKMEEFIGVMSSLAESFETGGAKKKNKLSHVRSLICDSDSTFRYRRTFKKRKMECSTPINTRRDQLPSTGMEESPIDNANEDVVDEKSSENDSLGKAGVNETGVSQETCMLQITPPKSESSSLTNRQLFTTALNWSDAAEKKGIKMRRTHSEPRQALRLIENSMYREYPMREVDIMKSPEVRRANSMAAFLETNDLSPWSLEDIDKLRMDVDKLNLGRIADKLNLGDDGVKENVKKILTFSPIKIPDIGGISTQTLGLKSAKRSLAVSPNCEEEHRRKVSIGEGSSPILRMKTNVGNGGRNRAHTVGSPFARRNHDHLVEPRERAMSSSNVNHSPLPSSKRKKAIPKMRITARSNMEEKPASKPKKQVLISSIFPSTPKGN